jgi:hypothetical protein
MEEQILSFGIKIIFVQKLMNFVMFQMEQIIAKSFRIKVMFVQKFNLQGKDFQVKSA